MDAFATAISLAMQYGVPLRALVDKFSHMRFEPSGFTKSREIPIAKSIIDYIFRWLAARFLSREEKEAVGVILRDSETPETAGASVTPVLQASRDRRRTAANHVSDFDRRTQLPRLRFDHGAERQLLQMPELRIDERVQLMAPMVPMAPTLPRNRRFAAPGGSTHSPRRPSA